MQSFREFVKTTFDHLKCKAKNDPLVSLPVRNSSGKLIAFMTPIIQEYAVLDPKLPELLTRWRIENPTISTGKFIATSERTERWLDQLVVGRDDRLIFMIKSIDGVPLGHIGFSSFNYDDVSAEIDSVLRGVKEGYPGLMSLATEQLIQWGYQTLKLKSVTLSVYSDNESAVRFYERLGFVKTVVKPLYKIVLADEEKLEIAPEGYQGPIEKYYLYMKYEGKRADVTTL